MLHKKYILFTIGALLLCPIVLNHVNNVHAEAKTNNYPTEQINISKRISSNPSMRLGSKQDTGDVEYSLFGKKFSDWGGFHKLSRSQFRNYTNHINYNIQRATYNANSHLKAVPMSNGYNIEKELANTIYTEKHSANNKNFLNQLTTARFLFDGLASYSELKGSADKDFQNAHDLEHSNFNMHSHNYNSHAPVIRDKSDLTAYGVTTRKNIFKNIRHGVVGIVKSLAITDALKTAYDDQHHAFFTRKGTTAEVMGTLGGNLWKVIVSVPSSKPSHMTKQTSYIMSSDLFNYFYSIKPRASAHHLKDNYERESCKEFMKEILLNPHYWSFANEFALLYENIDWNTLMHFYHVTNKEAHRPYLIILPNRNEQSNFNKAFHIKHHHFPSYPAWLRMMYNHKYSASKHYHNSSYERAYQQHWQHHHKHHFYINLSRLLSPTKVHADDIHHNKRPNYNNHHINHSNLYNLGYNQAKALDNNINAHDYARGHVLNSVINSPYVENGHWQLGFRMYMTNHGPQSLDAAVKMESALDSYHDGNSNYRRGWLDEVHNFGVLVNINDKYNNPDYKDGWTDAYADFTNAANSESDSEINDAFMSATD